MCVSNTLKSDWTLNYSTKGEHGIFDLPQSLREDGRVGWRAGWNEANSLKHEYEDFPMACHSIGSAKLPTCI